MRSKMRRSSRRGSQAVEFALCLPIIATVLFGILEYGVMFNQWLSILSATRDGARWGANPGVELDEAEDEAIAQVRSSLALLGLSCTTAEQSRGDCQVVSGMTEVEGLDAVRVSTSIDYTPMTGGLLPVPEQLTSSSIFVIINQSADTGDPGAG